MYSPDAQGLYQLCHGIVPGQPLNAFTAKEGVPVEEAASGRKGALVRPISVAMPDDDGGAPVSVVWRVAWEGGVTQDFELWSGEAAANNGALMVRGRGRENNWSPLCTPIPHFDTTCLYLAKHSTLDACITAGVSHLLHRQSD